VLAILVVAGRVVAGLAVVLVVLVAASAAFAAMTRPEARGRMVEIEPGRRMRLVCEGAGGAGPPVWLEAGAFGFAADWGSVQARLAAAGFRSCAYDRAGLGWSDPGPQPRDADSIAADLERLMAASGETGPYLIVGHSAAGLYIRRFAALHPERIAGLVLVDAMTPEQASSTQARGFVTSFRSLSRVAAAAASLGLFKPLIWTGQSDRIGLVGAAHAEKRAGFASGRHNRGAAAEVWAWPAAIAQAGASRPYDPDLPVAVVLADRGGDPAAVLGSPRAAPGRDSRRGRVEVVEGAEHATLLGERFSGRIVEAVRFVSETRTPRTEAAPPPR
jgi:pimeloyl-ACP methyl ester carboxylesterase